MAQQNVSILIIEDDPSIARSLQDALGDEGYRVNWQTEGQPGIAFAADHHPHLIILDVRLPDGSGFDVCRQMRQMSLHQPILMLTVQRDEVDKIIGLEIGADDYMTKPFAVRELLSRVRALLRRTYGEFSGASTRDTALVGDLLIDRNKGQVFRGDEALNLTPTEFRLLDFLVRHRGQAFSRAAILDHVWGYAADVESEQIVTVHVRRLREKVELNASRPTLILTVPGIGYRLAAG